MDEILESTEKSPEERISELEDQVKKLTGSFQVADRFIDYLVGEYVVGNDKQWNAYSEYMEELRPILKGTTIFCNYFDDEEEEEEE